MRWDGSSILFDELQALIDGRVAIVDGSLIPGARNAAETFRLDPKLYFVSNSLCHDPVGTEEVDDGLWSVYYCHLVLAHINLWTATLTRG